MSGASQANLFAPVLAPGLIYRSDFIDRDAESALLEHIRALPLREAQYRQYTARRRTVNFGFSYDFQHLEAKAAPPIPQFLAPLRERAAQWAGVASQDFVQALIAQYTPGTPLGWHRDVPDFEDIVGISLLGNAVMRLRPYPPDAPKKADVLRIALPPRSIYLLRGAARWAWQHGVAPAKQLRYSITLRTPRVR
jgi:alkylated DNA repair dioxygenase AlkB